MKTTQLGALALMALGLAGWEGGCGPRQPPPTGSTSSSIGGTTGQGGSTGTTGSRGTTGSSGDCYGLDESDCTARADCQAVYQPVTCGSDAFVGCERKTPVVCPMYECAEPQQGAGWTCTTPVDENGCPGCPVCTPPVQVCSTDADCPEGEACVTGTVNCPPGAYCIAPAPTCQPIVVCPDIACAPVDPTWICEPSTDSNGCPTCGNCHPSSCTTDSDCGSGFACAHSACPAGLPLCSQVQPGTQPPCCPDEGQCVAQPTGCHADSDCGSTQHCLPDPTDPCNGPEYDCFVAGRLTCQSVLCQSDSDCGAGQTCVQLPPVPCAEGADCMIAASVCENAPVACSTDSDCSSGQTCQSSGPLCNSLNCPDQVRTCQPAPGCQSNADCASGEICARSDRACDATAPCPVDAAVCMPDPNAHNCGNTDCSASQICVHSVGGAPGPGGMGINTYACVATPELCERVDESGCDCAASVCGQGGVAVCGSPIQVTCNLP